MRRKRGNEEERKLEVVQGVALAEAFLSSEQDETPSRRLQRCILGSGVQS